MKQLVFDAANTLIHKPSIWEIWQKVLELNNVNLPLAILKHRHKLSSETILFPDRTSKQFYKDFNAKVLFNCGIAPSDDLLEDLFQNLTYQPWEVYDDICVLYQLETPLYVASNFKTELRSLLSELIPVNFEDLFISEEIGIRKPSIKFYQEVVNRMACKPEDIIYVGDSLELDIAPALKLGINAYLLDRDNYYPYFEKRLGSLEELKNLLT